MIRSAPLPLSAFLLSLLAFEASAYAQAAPAAPAPVQPAETVKAQTATTGKTDIAKGGFVTAAERKDDDPRHVNDVTIGAGGLFSAGNARTVALTSVVRARFRRDEHQFSGAFAVNFARAGKKDEAIETTVENFQGLLRYDYFLTNNISLFLQAAGRRDRFQGLDLRLNIDPGVAYYFFNTKQHRLQVEAGYDLQIDIRRDDALIIPPPADAPPGTDPTRLDKSKTLHNARIFLGYENKLRKEVAFIASAEYLQNFGDFETFRFIGDVGLKSNVSDNLALATTYTARYENKPLPGVEKLDSIASINLVYSLF